MNYNKEREELVEYGKIMSKEGLSSGVAILVYMMLKKD